MEDEHSASDHFGKAITVSSTYQPPSSTSEPARKISPTPLTNGPPPSGDILRMPQPYAGKIYAEMLHNGAKKKAHLI